MTTTDEAAALVDGEWKRECEFCGGEGTVERGDMPLHHLHSEAPEYATADCGECDGAGWNWTDDDVTLADCPIGLFVRGETLALKTEYGNNEGRIDAYIVSSGEFFWGKAPQSIASQRATLVRPVDLSALTIERDRLLAERRDVAEAVAKREAALIESLNLGAVNALRLHQRQIDATGEMVGVSRQALNEILDWIDNQTGDAVEAELAAIREGNHEHDNG